MAERDIRRGDIYYYDFGENKGSIQSGKRPILIVQADSFNMNAPTVIAAAITTVIKKQYMPSHILLPETSGLNRPSMVMLEQIRAVNKSDLKEYVGSLGDEQTWRDINRGIKKAFGLWIYKQERSADIRCLCSKCAKDYMNAGLVIKRLDPFAKTKEKCCKCESLGYDYIVLDKRKTI